MSQKNKQPQNIYIQKKKYNTRFISIYSEYTPSIPLYVINFFFNWNFKKNIFIELSKEKFKEMIK